MRLDVSRLSHVSLSEAAVNVPSRDECVAVHQVTGTPF